MDGRPVRITRRGFLAGTIAAAVAACTDGDSLPSATEETPADAATTTPPSTEAPPTAEATTTTSPPTTAPTTTAPTTTAPTTTAAPAPVTDDPFTLGVASGDPLPDRVMLWTRLAPADGTIDGDVAVEWEVATDEAMTEPVASGAATAIAALGHSVHVDATGLEPDRVYWFRFRVGDFETPPARTRTFAEVGTTPERFRFAFSSCQNWEQGYYAAYRDLLEGDDLDAFVFLGDYIYEYASGGYADPRARVTGQDFECVTIDQYRARYALYRSDPLLQAAHAHVPWIITWDDHEVDNDYADEISQGGDGVEAFRNRRAAAYQAWYEFMPVRLPAPDGPDYPIFRSFAHGDLLRFHVLDTRQYRSDQQQGPAFVDAVGDAVQERDDAVVTAEGHTMLGDEQRAWLFERASESTAVWDVLAQQVFMFGANAVGGADPPIVVVDTWDGYPAERELVVDTLAESVDNLVVVTGDFHSAAVADLRSDPFDPTRPVVGTEFMASAISSAFFDDTEAITQLVSAAIAANPHLKFFDGRRGYTICDVTPTEWRSTFRAVVDPFDEASPVETISEWIVTAGTPGANQVA